LETIYLPYRFHGIHVQRNTQLLAVSDITTPTVGLDATSIAHAPQEKYMEKAGETHIEI